MFKKRFVPRRRGSFRSSGPKPLGRPKNRITRVQRCQFFLRTGIVNNSNDPFLTTYSVAFQLARVDSLFDELNIGTGRALSQMTKSIDVTRIHFDYGWDTDDDEKDLDTASVEFNRFFFHTAVVVDREDPSGLPAAASNVPWFVTQSPAAQATATTPVLASREENWPQRVLHERTEWYDHGVTELVDGAEGILYVPQFQNVRPGNRNGYVSKRLSCRLSQQEGLYVVASVAQDLGVTDTSFKFWAHGAFYYRVNI